MIGEITASRMTEGRWMFTRLREPRRPHGGTPCTVIGVRECSAIDALVTVEWLHERAAGYPSLKQFEGGANWPK